MAADLKRLIDRTQFAISTEETRYYLNGIHMHAAERDGRKTLRAVATDGHRLALAEADLPDGAGAMPAVIIPRKPIQELRRLLEDLDDDIEMSVSEGKIRFRLGAAVLTSKLIDGTFPDYERVIPTSNERVALLATQAFGAAVDRVATISMEKARPVKLAFETGRVTVSAASPEAGRAEEELDCEWRGEPLEIGFNARYVLDMVGQVEGPELRMEMANAAAPMVVKDPADPAVLFVLMPMRV